MPRWLTRALSTQLEEQKLPYYRIVDGPEPMDQRVTTSPHIVLQRDQATGDTIGPPKGRGKVDARNLFLETVGMELLIYARSPEKGATSVDHEDQADAIRRQLLVGLYHVFQSYDGPRWRLGVGRFLAKQEIEELRLQQWTGRIYRLPFSYDEAVKDTDYKGAGADTVEGGDFTFETETETEGAGGTELPCASTEVS